MNTRAWGESRRRRRARSPSGRWWPLAALVWTFAGCDPGPNGGQVVGQLAWDRVELTAEAAEPVVALAVREGQSVASGGMVVRLDDTRARARLAQRRAERQRAEAVLAELKRGPRPERIAVARAVVQGSAARLAQAERDLRRQRELSRLGLNSEEALDRAQTEVRRARAEREAAAQRLAELERGATAEELEQAVAAVAQAGAAEREAGIALERLRLTAPQAGRVDALPFELGERPPVGAVVAVLLVGEAPYARVYLPEPLRALIHPGDRAEVYVDGRPKAFPGRVRRISRDPVFTPFFTLTERDRRHLAFLAEVVLERGAGLPAGVPVEVVFPNLRARDYE